MVIPLPSVSVTPVPSQCALKSRPWLFALTFLVLLHVVEMFWFRNILGGFLMLVLVFVGIYTLRERSVDVHCLIIWGMLCFINGIFSMIELIHRTVQPDSIPIFAGPRWAPILANKRIPLKLWEWNMLNAINLVGIVALCAISVVSFVVFKKSVNDMVEQDEQETAALMQATQPRRQTASNNTPPGSAAGDGQAGLAAAGGSSFQPFSGAGNRVGGAEESD
ncbi:unnamed protein product [Amoebophrya sp. A25]|nr:unnamed protein product [Amoebophrya sp. A25]|eukprot:GSA25T00017484001.1